jgi:hypothetical protein
MLSLQGKKYDYTWSSDIRNAYNLANSKMYDRKIFTIPRPFPVFKIICETNSDRAGVLSLFFRTHLGQSLINHTLSYVTWDKQYRYNFSDRFIWHFDLNRNSFVEIKELFNAIFKQLNAVTDVEIIQNSLLEIHIELMKMLDIYLQDFHKNFPDNNFFLNGRDQEIEYVPITDKNASAKEMYDAIWNLETHKVLTLLKKGISPNIYYQGWTPLITTILFGIGEALRFKGRDKNWLLPKVLSIIGLLLEYGAYTMYESSDEHTAMEKLVIESTFNRCTVDFYAAILQLLVAGNDVHPHIFVSEQARMETIGLIVSGSNVFLKQLSENFSPKIIDCFRQNHLYFLTHLNTFIIVETVTLENLSQKSKQNLYQLFVCHFPEQPASYFQELLEKNTSAIDMIYMDNKLVGMNIVTTILMQFDKTFILHYIKLAIADKNLNAFPRFMSIISFARGFALQNKFPLIDVITYYEAASSSSYLQTCHLETFPKREALQNIMQSIGKYLYPEKLLPLENSLLVEDELAGPEKRTAPLLFWDEKPEKKQKLPAKIDQTNVEKFFLTNRQLAQVGFKERYFKEKYCVTIGFFNHENNLKDLKKKINPHCLPGIFDKAIKCYEKIGPDPAILKQPRL